MFGLFPFLFFFFLATRKTRRKSRTYGAVYRVANDRLIGHQPTQKRPLTTMACEPAHLFPSTGYLFTLSLSLSLSLSLLPLYLSTRYGPTEPTFRIRFRRLSFITVQCFVRVCVRGCRYGCGCTARRSPHHSSKLVLGLSPLASLVPSPSESICRFPDL